MRYTREDILRLVEEEDIEFIRLQFTDMFGAIKNMAVTVSQLDKVLDNKIVFDGTCVQGHMRRGEADMYLHPDLDTFVIFPWRPQQGKVARFVCDIYTVDGKPYEGASRNVLKKVMEECRSMGYEFLIGPEMEFFLFHTDENGTPTTITHEKAGYFDVGPLDMGENVRRDIVLNLEEMGFEVEASHHEVSPGQHEVDFKYSNAVSTADNIMTFKQTVKSISKRHGLYATFMPKPKQGVAGSGMHLNMALGKDLKNAFSDKSDPFGLNELAYEFMAGIMAHIKGIALFTNPLVNSYKRLANGYEAPIYIGWSDVNGMPLLRVPNTGEEEWGIIELRSPDPSSNPYLAIAAILAAGLDGIKNHMKCPERMRDELNFMTPDEIRSEGENLLPLSLGEAIEEFEKDEFLQNVMGKHITEKYLEAKKKEWKEYLTQVTDWEVNECLYRY